jgi:hypothetical protein
MALKGEWSLHATVIGILSCVMISLTFLVPWYGADYEPFYGGGYRVEYIVGTGGSDLMSTVTIVLTLSLVASVIAALLSYLNRRVSGVIAGTFAAGLLLAAAGIFYFGIVDALHLESFAGITLLNRTWSVETAPMLGWWIAAIVPVIQAAQAVVLAYANHCGPRKSP